MPCGGNESYYLPRAARQYISQF
ncbi:hypothetical protein OOU_Y34scaffold00896g10 [Pyricularia oryzae Y34]|uniref:Uncharacterized protein n=2 Tax=Pyricularia oryzae TaxID=318829 RepID=A0AA97NP56_PYRO3|nr:hypothetical protein OOU_Y34scaffold00896g10 [Pyricularia oryzae Y34]